MSESKANGNNKTLIGIIVALVTAGVGVNQGVSYLRAPASQEADETHAIDALARVQQMTESRVDATQRLSESNQALIVATKDLAQAVKGQVDVLAGRAEENAKRIGELRADYQKDVSTIREDVKQLVQSHNNLRVDLANRGKAGNP